MRRPMILAALAIGIAPAIAQQPAPNACFQMSEMQGWKAPDSRTMFIRVNVNQYYRLDLAGACPMLTFPDSHIITKTRGTNLICTPADWDLSVSQSPPGAIPVPCIVKQMTRLTPEQAAAIPPKFRP